MGNKLDRFVHVRPLHRPPKTVWCKWAGIIHFQPSAIHLLVPFTAPFFIFQIDGWWSSNSAHVTLLGLRVSSECDHWLNFCRIFKSWRPQRAPFGRNLNLKKTSDWQQMKFARKKKRNKWRRSAALIFLVRIPAVIYSNEISRWNVSSSLFSLWPQRGICARVVRWTPSSQRSL